VLRFHGARSSRDPVEYHLIIPCHQRRALGRLPPPGEPPPSGPPALAITARSVARSAGWPAAKSASGLGRVRTAFGRASDCEHSGNYASVPLFLLIVATSEAGHDPQAEIRRIPALFPQGEPEDGQAAQSRNLQVACGRGKTRARRAIFQATLRPVVSASPGMLCTGRKSADFRRHFGARRSLQG